MIPDRAENIATLIVGSPHFSTLDSEGNVKPPLSPDIIGARVHTLVQTLDSVAEAMGIRWELDGTPNRSYMSFPIRLVLADDTVLHLGHASHWGYGWGVGPGDDGDNLVAQEFIARTKGPTPAPTPAPPSTPDPAAPPTDLMTGNKRKVLDWVALNALASEKLGCTPAQLTRSVWTHTFSSTAGPHRGGLAGCAMTPFEVVGFEANPRNLPHPMRIKFCAGLWAAWDGVPEGWSM